jgi:hypothetical protein
MAAAADGVGRRRGRRHPTCARNLPRRRANVERAVGPDKLAGALALELVPRRVAELEEQLDPFTVREVIVREVARADLGGVKGPCHAARPAARLQRAGRGRPRAAGPAAAAGEVVAAIGATAVGATAIGATAIGVVRFGPKGR